MLLKERGVDIAESDEMAKKKAAERKGSRQVILLVYKADEAMAEPFKEWLEGLAADVGAPVTVTVDMALKEFGLRRKYKPMPKRLAR